MLPANVPSSLSVGASLMSPDTLASDLLQDYERGGVEINDASQGLNVRDWRVFLSGADQVRVQAGSDPSTLVFTQSSIEELVFAFDQLMRPTVAYRIVSNWFLRWYDSTVPGFVITPLGAWRDVKLSLDDKRVTQVGTNSDVILGYIREGSLYYRQQRDRYEIERLMRANLPVNTRLISLGMNRALRLQFELA